MRLTICVALLVFAGLVPIGAQTNFYPFNPDADSDGFVESSDLLAFLAAFGKPWGLTADYTPIEIPDSTFEGLVYNLFQGNYSLDSMYIYYVIQGIHSWHPPGDPTLQVDTIYYEREAVLYPTFTNDGIPGKFNPAGFHAVHGQILGEPGYVGIWITREGTEGASYSVSTVDFTATNHYFHSIGFNYLYGPRSEWQVTNENHNGFELVNGTWHWPHPYWSNVIGTSQLTEYMLIPYVTQL